MPYVNSALERVADAVSNASAVLGQKPPMALRLSPVVSPFFVGLLLHRFSLLRRNNCYVWE